MGQTEARLRLEGKVDDTRRLLVIVMSVLALVLAMPGGGDRRGHSQTPERLTLPSDVTEATAILRS